ncbi:MAG: hypothetical protein ACPGSB_09480, partial [Opitutales bacterium]
FLQAIPKMTSEARRTGREADMYVYDGKFIPNDDVMGRWIRIGLKDAAGLEKWAKDFKRRGSKLGKQVYIFNIQDNGRIKGEVFMKKMGNDNFWSGDLLIGKYINHEARRLHVMTVEGLNFLLVEDGGFGTIENARESPVADDWTPGYSIYLRAPK